MRWTYSDKDSDWNYLRVAEITHQSQSLLIKLKRWERQILWPRMNQKCQ